MYNVRKLLEAPRKMASSFFWAEGDLTYKRFFDTFTRTFPIIMPPLFEGSGWQALGE